MNEIPEWQIALAIIVGLISLVGILAAIYGIQQVRREHR